MEIRLLGPFEVRSGTRAIDVPSGRMRSLFAALALSAGRSVAMDVLIDRVWGGEAPLNARQSLQNNVWRLRRLLGSELIVADGDGYRLAVDPDRVDVLEFQRLLDAASAADAADPDLSAVRDALERALRLWQGDPLTGVDSEPLRRDYAAALTERYLAALELRIDLDLAAGRHGDLIAELRGLTARHPLREPLWERLLIALSRCGRQAEALHAYEEVRRLLADSLGADPSAGLREIHHRLLRAEPEPGSSNEPEPAAAGAPPSPPPRQLPAEARGFVGRDEHLRELRRRLDRHEAAARQGSRPVLTLVLHGTGGVGKTALALSWAHEVAERFPDGQLYLDLQGYGPGDPISPGVALGSLLRSVGVPGPQLPDETGERAGLWRSVVTGRRLLVLLDNARSPDQVRPLLPGSDCVVVVTSRSQLRGLSTRDGAVSLALQELTDDEARAVLSEAVGARRAADEADAADDLARLCGRLPLALRITADLASRHHETPLAKFAAELRDQRLERLSDTDDPASDPRAVFSWSCRSLDPRDARAFRLLSLHPAEDFGVAAAAALIGTPVSVTGQVMDRLAAVHLLEQRSPGRYRFHDLLREYAAEQTVAEEPAAERDAATRRMLDWHLQTAGRANTALRLGAVCAVLEPEDPAIEPLEFSEPSEALSWCRAELPALVAVTRHAAEHGHPAHAQQLAWVLTSVCELTHRLDEWLAMAEAGYRGSASLDVMSRYRAAYTLGSALSSAYRLDESEAYKREALRHATEVGDPAAVTSALNSLGVLYENMGDNLAARAQFQKALQTARDNGLAFRAAHALLNLGSNEIRDGDVETGLARSEQALAAYRELDAPFHQGMALSNLAEGQAVAGRLEQAVTCADRAMELFGQAEEAPTPAVFLVPIGQVYAEAGLRDKARAVLRKGVDALRGQRHPMLADAERLLADLDGPG